MGVAHTSLDADGKIRGKHWKANHTLSAMLMPSRTIFFDVNGLAAYNPPATWGAGAPNLSNKTKTYLPFNFFQPSYARIMAMWERSGVGMVGQPPNMRLTSTEGEICQVQSSGTPKALRVGSWTDCSSFLTDIEVYIETEDGKADRTWDIYSIAVEFR